MTEHQILGGASTFLEGREKFNAQVLQGAMQMLGVKWGLNLGRGTHHLFPSPTTYSLDSYTNIQIIIHIVSLIK